jgi:hypothetical protein
MFTIIMCFQSVLLMAQGSPGAAGQQGPRGSMGGVGIQGPRGASGVRGAEGAAGAVGITGPQGVRGMGGANGAFGPNGLRGPQGSKGPRGDASRDDQKVWDTGPFVLPPLTSCNSFCAQHASSVNPGWSYACVGAKWGSAYIPCTGMSLFPVADARCVCFMITR